MNPTQQQIKTLTGEKCLECNNGYQWGHPMGQIAHKICESCNGTGLPPIKAKKAELQEEESY